jgi:hypothetical protein
LPGLFQKHRFRDSKPPKAVKGFEVLLEFDKSLNLPDTWISEKELACFNMLREDMSLS